MKKIININNSTAGGKQNINIEIDTVSINEFLTCVEEKAVRDSCKLGCINYGKKWSCPPYSNDISKIIKKKSYDRVIVIVGCIFIEELNYIKNAYQQIKAANVILKSKCEKIARYIEKETNGYSLLSGSCNLCKPCYKKRGMPCNKPQIMRYSLESTGVNVDLLTRKYFSHQLLWYKRDDKPLYTSVVTAVLVENTCPTICSEKATKDILFLDF